MDDPFQPNRDGRSDHGSTPSTTVDANALIAQLKLVADNPDVLKDADEAQLNEIKGLSRRAAESLETPFESFQRVAYSPLPLVTAKIGQDHRIFTTLAASAEPVSLSKLVEASGIQRPSLEPVMDYLCTQNMARQVGRDLFMPTRMTNLMFDPKFQDGLVHFYNLLYLGWGWLNKALREPTSKRTAWQMAYNTDLNFYEWLEDQPENKAAFHRFMDSNLSDRPSWLDVVDFESEFGAGLRETDVAFVDVGGGNGQQCELLRQRVPGLKGRVILQDKPDVLGTALEVDRMETMDYDYLTGQPVKGARVYYLRQIMHNNDDETCVKILQSHIPAMGANSVIVLDEKVLPDDRPAPDTLGAEYSASLSLAMKMIFNAQERREAHWRRLLEGTGLVIREIRTFSPSSEAAVILETEDRTSRGWRRSMTKL